jgi:hypothetical protein
MKMAALMHRKSQNATTPENRKKLAELADGHRKIARLGRGKDVPKADFFGPITAV